MNGVVIVGLGKAGLLHYHAWEKIKIPNIFFVDPLKNIFFADTLKFMQL